jgi:integrase
MATSKRADKFPLWLHPRGLWCKKIRGTFYYFGKDKAKALKEYVRVREDLEAGRKPPPLDQQMATVADVVNSFLEEKQARVDAKELSPRTWADYYAVCDAVVEEFGRGTAVADLRPADFAKLRAGVASRLSPTSVLNFVTRVRVLFKFTFDFGLIDSPVRYGSGFDRPAKKTLRLERAVKPVKLLAAGDVWKLIRAADPQLKAMIYLGLNGGMGATDCAQLPRQVLEGRAGWINYHRPKTGVGRHFALWPETTRALAAVAAIRPAAKDPTDDRLVFLTRLGKPWVRFHGNDKGKRSVIDSVSQMFAKLGAKTGVKLPSGFNTLRHLHRTLSDAAKDRPAADLIMGHVDQSVASYYREHIADERLLTITNQIRSWLLAGKQRRCPRLSRRTLGDKILEFKRDGSCG